VYQKFREIQMRKIDLYAESKCLKRSNLLERFVQLRGVGPEAFVAERIVSEYFPALLLELRRHGAFGRPAAADP
jgi:hypothetical protein